MKITFARFIKFFVVLTVFCVIWFIPERTGLASAQAQTAAISPEQLNFFEQKIRPVLVSNCYQCHSAEAKKLAGGLRLDTREGMLKGGTSGQAAIVPGDPDKSLLIKAISYTDPKLQMPYGGKLADAIINDFKQWVKIGAPDPRQNQSANTTKPQPYDFVEAKKFWSYQPVKNISPPPVKNTAWLRSPIDNFILAKLEEKMLMPVGDADKRTLLRRATFDLTGLPPMPREVEEFLQDRSANAFEKVIDRLLSSRHYGERWGRHWLDLGRYADTAGDNSDFPVPSAYKYRNYVINAFNQDKPYDQFIREQLAGDLLASRTEAEKFEQITATGYIAISRRFGSRDTDHNLAIDDTIENVGKAFLGLSVNCARCHDHKFDPIPTKDYYALYGIFNSARYAFPGTEIYPHPHSLTPLVSGAEAERLQKYQTELGELDRKKEACQVERGIVRGKQLQQAPEVLAKGISKGIKTDQIGREIPVGKLIEEDQDDRNLKAAEASPRSVEQINADLAVIKNRMLELDAEVPRIEKAYAVTEGNPHHARIHRKGDPKNLGDEAPRGFLQILGGQILPSDCKTSGRVELANWISDAKNPLTARVMVNRIWLHHFGKGIVATPNDFGIRGKAPTHPELLDYLATQFIEDGWSIKKMHKLMMLSHAYQLGSLEFRVSSFENPPVQTAQNSKLETPNPKLNTEIDVSNEYLWHFNRRRLDAEEIRDAMLMVSGALDRSVGEAHPFPPENTWKYSQHNPFVATYDHNQRSVYLMQQRIRAHPQLSIFDGADTNSAMGERVPSTTPLQALFMMNDPFIHKQADILAVRVGMAFNDDTRRIEYAYRLAFGRVPSLTEIKLALDYLRDIRPNLHELKLPEEEQTRAALASYLHVLLSSSEFIFVD